MKLELVEIGDDIAVRRVLRVAKDVVAPLVAVGTNKIALGYLLKGVDHMESFQHRQISWFLAVILVDVLDKARPGKSPLVWADGAKEGWKAVLADSVDEARVLPLSVGSRKGFLLKAAVWTAARCLG